MGAAPAGDIGVIWPGLASLAASGVVTANLSLYLDLQVITSAAETI